ncbi:MAG: uL15m family ribosomal protein [Candidatus Micrarchaeota archaeon]
MARRIKSKMRKHYANRTFGSGNTKNRRGKGSRGGVGRAGFHKHKRFQYLKSEGPSTTVAGFVNVSRKKIEVVGLNELSLQIERGAYKKAGDAYEIDLRRKGRFVKLLGNGEFGIKANIKADAHSDSAKEKVEKAGGQIIILKAKEPSEKQPVSK